MFPIPKVLLLLYENFKRNVFEMMCLPFLYFVAQFADLCPVYLRLLERIDARIGPAVV